MDLLFVYDERVARDDDGNYYIGSSLNQNIFNRYLQHFTHVTLIARPAKGAVDTARMNRLDSAKVTVVMVPDLRESVQDFINPGKKRQVCETIKREICSDRAVIVRVPSTCGTIAADHCRKIGKPYLAEVVGCPWDSYWNHSLAGKAMAPHEYLQQARVVRNADYALYVTSEFLQRRYPTGGFSAGISDVELQQTEDLVLEKRLAKLRSHCGRWKLATAAAVNAAYKGQHFVIEALAKLKAQGNTDFEYHLAGGGEPSALRDLAERLGVSDQVIFEGSLPHDAMFEWLDDMDLYIQPSLQEGLPRAVVEAMSRGLPALGAHTGGIPELLGEDCIFPRKGVDAIAELLTALKPEQMIAMAAKNFDHAKQFQKEPLEQKRYAFYSAFAAEVKEKQQ